MIDTTIPTGISAGATIFLAIVSDINKRSVPTKADTGNNNLCFGPTIFLAICGEIRPKKEIVPATEVATPANATAKKISIRRAFST